MESPSMSLAASIFPELNKALVMNKSAKRELMSMIHQIGKLKRLNRNNR
jgi:hypothetical protein